MVIQMLSKGFIDFHHDVGLITAFCLFDNACHTIPYIINLVLSPIIRGAK